VSELSAALAALATAAAAAVDTDRLTELTRALVQTRSVVDPDSGSSEAAAADLLADTLRGAGLAPIVEEVAPGRPNVICDWSGSRFDPERDRTLMFEGHSDVVTEGDAADWSYPPFGADIVEGRLYGRGSADMKGGVAAAIVATEAVRRVAPDLPGRIRLGFVVDEEGMMIGIKSFIANGWADEVDGAIVCEPEENELCLFQKGAMRVTVDVVGRMAHGAMPYAGVNPIPPLAAFVSGVGEIERAEQARLGEHPYLGLPWLTPTIVRAPLRGEAQNNVMPGHARLALDIRTVPGQHHAELLAALERLAAELIDRTPGLGIEVDLFESRPWTETPGNDPLVAALEAVYPKIVGGPPRYGGVPGATDGTFLRATAGVPIVTVGAGDRTIPHQRDEFVRLDDLAVAARLYAAAAVVYLGNTGNQRPDRGSTTR
jgi:succinyl-diaminopimelate desuccinylase